MAELEGQILSHLRTSAPEFLTASTARSTRAAGDAIEDIVCKALPDLLGDITGAWVKDLSRRAMADARIQTASGSVYDIDVKTHRVGTGFSMSNLISWRRLAQFYERPENTFLIVLISYEVEGHEVTFESCRAFPIEWLSWESLSLGLLGWGQIQFTDTRSYKVVEEYSRAAWMTELCDRLLAFYPNEIAKIQDRIAFVRRTRERWTT
ncbi:MAG: hypothetical protein C0506_03745 [Anaerolinea sp.]|nr:hypothetical protein [Anaerolinea sp.]